MILLIHRKAQSVIRSLEDGKEIPVKASNCTEAFWELTVRFPEELIAWCEEKYLEDLNPDKWQEVFHHDLIMASYAVEHVFLPESIGYVDQMPFINVQRDVLYGTWRMSSDVGGIKGKVLLRFKDLLGDIKDLDYLLNSVAKLGQQNSLFCYSAPGLVKSRPEGELQYTASTAQLFSFVYQHYNNIWTGVLFWCFIKYEEKFPLMPFVRSFFRRKYFRRSVDLSDVPIQSTKKRDYSTSIDVIIPTMGRMKYLLDVIKDLSLQTHLPQKVIIVEQNPDKSSSSELIYLKNREWPFEIVHHFTHQTGVCNARNIALNKTTADWVFLSDDDQRFENDLLESTFHELKKYGVDGITTSYLQPGEKKKFEVPKQWGTFGAGNSVVRRRFTKKAAFLMALEYGYGEDKEFGMQLRKAGCDIIYHPRLEIQHLKAPNGGFRIEPDLEWEKEEPLPKPSPTLMVYALRHYTPEQIKGYKTILFLKFYNRQSKKNPFAYIREMKKRWKKSEELAEQLLATPENRL